MTIAALFVLVCFVVRQRPISNPESDIGPRSPAIVGEAHRYGADGELVPLTGDQPVYRNTIERPEKASASRSRLYLPQEAGTLEAGLDVADTIQAANSVEMMISHQQAALHPRGNENWQAVRSRDGPG